MSWKSQKGNHAGNISWSFKLRSGRSLSRQLKKIETSSRHPTVNAKSLKRCYMGG